MAWPPTAGQVRSDLRRSSTQVPDDDLVPFIAAAVAHLESGDQGHPGIGPHGGQSLVANRRFYRRGDLVLPWRAASVELLTVNGAEVEFTFDPEESPRIVFGPLGPGRIRAEYTAPSTVPADVERAAVVLSAHLWLQARPGAGGVEGTASPMGWAVPNRVWQLVGNYALANEEAC